MRLILCSACGAKPIHANQHPEDKAMGFQWRRTEIPHLKKPKVHHVVINGKRQPEMQTLFCDGCGVAIQDGAPGVAISQWRDGHMANWENEYSENNQNL